MLEVIDIEGQKMETRGELCTGGYQAGDDHDDPVVGGWLYVGNVS